MLPAPHSPMHWNAETFRTIRALIPDATTIALLCAIESLLSAVVADGMTGYRHRSDQELVAQGLANIGAAFFFGVPATGAIARTVANIKSGGKTPVAGMLHAVFLLVFMLALAPLAKMIPLATLAAVLMIVAWNISEMDHFRALLGAPKSDVLVLLTTFGLTVFADLTIAVGVGMVLAAMLFMKRMAEVSNVSSIKRQLENGEGAPLVDLKDPEGLERVAIPAGVEVFEIDGPFFFGVADRLKDTLNQFERPPKVFILRMRAVPHIDASGMHALDEFREKCKRQGIRLLLGGVHAQPMFEMVRVGLDEKIGLENIFECLEGALGKAREVVGAGAA
jgi:SulP family sulfate permease